MKAVLFDLDGTLLPMDLNQYARGYFEALGAHMAPLGYEPKKLVGAVWKGTDAMVRNDGARANDEVFWGVMTEVYGGKVKADIPLFDEFYATDFKRLREICGYNADAAATVNRIRAAGVTLVLASNPVFPHVAQAERLSWSGADPSIFSYFTSYSNSHYCKPRAEYYLEISDAIGVAPQDCLMVGNDVSDDSGSVKAGMDFFLLTDCLINNGGADISKFPHGGFKELNTYLEKKGLV